MPTDFDIPACANNAEGQHLCARSDTFIEREKDEAFVIRCRTCQGINIFPKLKAEQTGRYEAKLRHNMLEQQKQDAFRRKRSYSY